MNRILWAFGLISMACLLGNAQQTTSKAQAQNLVEPLAWLVGGVWTTDASKLAPNMVRIETRYTWSDNGAFVRFNTHFVMKEGTLKNYDGQFFWNPSTKSLRMWYMDARNEITEGSVSVDGDHFEFDFTGENFEGKPAELRVLLSRRSNDSYTWLLQEKNVEGWKELGKLDYNRSAN